MPAWVWDRQVVCFFGSAEQFKGRYVTLGFNHGALLDDGKVWPISFAVTIDDDAGDIDEVVYGR